ncbi:hypothetical protein [Sodalis sp. RH22]|uniref:hypothetical protein n=1 Tax=unclassified Sodalis (in: enterobacteria) TaxID=2636512 RepID=UPI0039B5E572
MNYVFITLLGLLGCCYVWSWLTIGSYGRFRYTNKRKKDVGLHLIPCKTPRNRAKSAAIYSSLRSILKKLKADGYETVSFESHLLDQRGTDIIQKIVTQEHISILSISYRKTPLWRKVVIPYITFIFRAKRVKVNKMSGKIVIKL